MLLTQKQKDILSGKLEVSSNYMRSVLSKKRRQIAKIIEELKFVAQHKPELLNIEGLVEIIASILRHGEITLEERTVKSVVFEGKRKKGRFVRIGGVLCKKSKSLYKKHEGPLKKPEIARKICFCYSLAEIIHREITRIAPIKGEVVHLLCKREDGQVKVKIERLDSWLRNFSSNLKDKEGLKDVNILVIEPS